MSSSHRIAFAVVLAVIGLGLEIKPAGSQGVIDSQEIERVLRPVSRSRSFSAPSTPAVVDRIKRSRGITIEDRTELADEVERGTVPAIDLEVQFDHDSTNLTPQAINQLQQLGRALSSDILKGVKIVLAGHTDARGTKVYNQSLSERRAAAVRGYLVKNFDLTPDQLLPVGYGQEQLKNARDPHADENRRVQILNLGR